MALALLLHQAGGGQQMAVGSLDRGGHGILALFVGDADGLTDGEALAQGAGTSASFTSLPLMM